MSMDLKGMNSDIAQLEIYIGHESECNGPRVLYKRDRQRKENQLSI